MLEQKRKNKQISQRQLAENLGVSNGYISQLEKRPETCNPTVKFILRLSRELEVDHLDLFSYFADSISPILEQSESETL
ncbi:helix-turn-helix transcriptional regulator [uncultured Clostridium sp.]|uniref:helix-turn-helix domain-containing protein n=1 Tax=uncultured Clostridium sp. TaxID=59620 RepID=UPI0028E900EB|nr:helix-turn-helix transcriptional regulator [uncultured Clostridium sp.]